MTTRKGHHRDRRDDPGSNSPELADVVNYIVDDPAFAKWPFHQSWEVQISGDFKTEDLTNPLTDAVYFGADFGGSDPGHSNFKLHASPIKSGSKFDVVLVGDPGDYQAQALNAIPTPAAGPQHPRLVAPNTPFVHVMPVRRAR